MRSTNRFPLYFALAIALSLFFLSIQNVAGSMVGLLSFVLLSAFYFAYLYNLGKKRRVVAFRAALPSLWSFLCFFGFSSFRFGSPMQEGSLTTMERLGLSLYEGGLWGVGTFLIFFISFYCAHPLVPYFKHRYKMPFQDDDY